MEKVEFIESYVKIKGGDYQWIDNHGELIRCKNCKHWENSLCYATIIPCPRPDEDWYCADGKRRKDDS